MDKARLRENARVVRTHADQLTALVKVRNARLAKEAFEAIERADRGGPVERPDDPDEETTIAGAQTVLLYELYKSFLDLTEELAGDIDQDLPRPR